MGECSTKCWGFKPKKEVEQKRRFQKQKGTGKRNKKRKRGKIGETINPEKEVKKTEGNKKREREGKKRKGINNRKEKRKKIRRSHGFQFSFR